GNPSHLSSFPDRVRHREGLGTSRSLGRRVCLFPEWHLLGSSESLDRSPDGRRLFAHVRRYEVRLDSHGSDDLRRPDRLRTPRDAPGSNGTRFFLTSLKPNDGLEGFDRVLEHRVRLGIAVLLARYDRISFSRFKKLLGETDGSLGAQLRKLEEEGYLAVRKEFRERKPASWYALTSLGRKALRSHLDALRQLIRTADEKARGLTQLK